MSEGIQDIRRFYTVHEANEALPSVSTLLFSMRKSRLRIVERQDELDMLDEKARHNGSAKLAESLIAEVEDAAHQLRADYDRLTAMGVELRDLEQGLVDFPAWRGRVVYLCWLFGEEEVGWWHEFGAGVAGRQPISSF